MQTTAPPLIQQITSAEYMNEDQDKSIADNQNNHFDTFIATRLSENDDTAIAEIANVENDVSLLLHCVIRKGRRSTTYNLPQVTLMTNSSENTVQETQVNTQHKKKNCPFGFVRYG